MKKVILMSLAMMSVLVSAQMAFAAGSCACLQQNNWHRVSGYQYEGRGIYSACQSTTPQCFLHIGDRRGTYEYWFLGKSVGHTACVAAYQQYYGLTNAQCAGMMKK